MLLTWLQSTLSKSILSRVIGSVHSYQVWEKIHEYFHTQTKACARQLRTDLRTTSLDGKTMREFLSQIKNIADELAGVGHPFPLDEYVDAILEGLPQDYAPVVSVIESKFATPPIAEVEALLLAHESRNNRFCKQSFSPSINYTHGYARGSVNHGGGNSGRRGGSSGRGRGGRFANFQCQICLKYSHTANICFYRADANYHPHDSLVLYDPSTLQPVQVNSPPSITKTSNSWGNPTSKQPSQDTNVNSVTPSAMLANTPSQGAVNSTWIPDSGASFHVTGEPQNVHQLGHFDGPDQIFIGNGQGLHINGSGFSSFLSPIKSNFCFKLNDLLHVPSITKNLLSVSKFAKDNSVYFEFHSHCCFVKSQVTNEILLQGVVGSDGLYSFSNLELQGPSVLVSSSMASSVDPAVSACPNAVSNSTNANKFSDVSLTPSSHTLWHTRLGHPNSHVLKLVLNHCNIAPSNRNGFSSPSPP
ncbi:uncharacterized protein LOC109796422, partial [Cajanus cajan]|uniref:uncharacterized protein LOC109796422 n=1 Tax=Cajanus cajan TaxID=3821 RepID=UPI0010FADDB1